MKIAKTFRLTPEAAKVLDDSENATQLIEALLLGTVNTDTSKLLKAIQKDIDYIKQQLADKQFTSSKAQPTAWSTVQDYPKEFTIKRTRTEILKDISDTEAEYAEKAEYCQDQQTLKQLKDECKEIVSDFWKEYRELDA